MYIRTVCTNMYLVHTYGMYKHVCRIYVQYGQYVSRTYVQYVQTCMSYIRTVCTNMYLVHTYIYVQICMSYVRTLCTNMYLVHYVQICMSYILTVCTNMYLVHTYSMYKYVCRTYVQVCISCIHTTYVARIDEPVLTVSSESYSKSQWLERLSIVQTVPASIPVWGPEIFRDCRKKRSLSIASKYYYNETVIYSLYQLYHLEYIVYLFCCIWPAIHGIWRPIIGPRGLSQCLIVYNDFLFYTEEVGR